MALQFASPIISICRTGNGVEGYSIAYPFHGSYPGSSWMFTAIYHSRDGKTDEVVGQTGDLIAAQIICQGHYDNLYPP